MNTFTIAGLIGIAVIFTGILFAGLMMWLSRLVITNQVKLEREQTAYNPAVTLGHKVPVNASKEEQLAAARLEAARRAAETPRWANMRIGRKGAEVTAPASAGLDNDPLTAVRIASFHTWTGARTGIPAGGVPQTGAVPVAAPAAAPSKKPSDLVPGKDYAYIAITGSMSGAEKRQARIANAKARSAAVKALKESAAAAPAMAPGQPAAAPAQAAAVAAAPAVSVPEPDLIEITDDMSPDEVRQARISNAKTQSAYKKALKAAQEAAPQPVPAAAPAPQAAAAVAAAPAVSVPEPDLIEITDDMSPDEVRQARIANAKTQSAYKKALKAAGVDLSDGQTATETAAPDPAVQPAAAPAAPATAAPAGQDALLASIPKPDLIEITDDMDPADVRSARISNAKAQSAYKKALKDAGIDPATVDL